MTYLFPTFDFVFLFDQSSGHTKLTSDGLHVGSMNVSYGGATTSMHDTVINEVGPYESLLDIGQKQLMNFSESDEGPFWLTSENKIASKYNRSVEGSTRMKKTKTEMLIELRRKGIDTTKKRYLVTDLLTMCNENNIDVNKTQSNDIPGWVGKPKGMLQILYERGYIDPNLVTNPRSMRYSKMGKKEDVDANSGSIKEDCQKYSLTHRFCRRKN